jgi:alkanesulfonate monooxygenase SsuD/methylene tetrahydromethanopterin reductase-like flavin-dependent oxidoreductase (luciferase family)
MAKIGRPILMNIQTIETISHRLNLYRDTMLEAGFDETAVEKTLDQTWAQRSIYVSDSDDEALETATLGLKRYRDHLLDARVKYNPSGEPQPASGQGPPAGEVVEHAFLVGTPKRVVEQLADLKDAGVRNLLLNVNTGQMTPEQVERSVRLFGKEVMPKFPAN